MNNPHYLLAIAQEQSAASALRRERASMEASEARLRQLVAQCQEARDLAQLIKERAGALAHLLEQEIRAASETREALQRAGRAGEGEQ